MRDARGQARRLCPKDSISWATVLAIKGSGGWKDCLFLSRTSSFSLVPCKVCIQISRRVVLKLLPLVWIWMRPHPTPNQWPEAILTPPLVKQGCPVVMAFLSNLLIYSDLPMSPKFSSLGSFIGTSTSTCAYSSPITTSLGSTGLCPHDCVTILHLGGNPAPEEKLRGKY